MIGLTEKLFCNGFNGWFYPNEISFISYFSNSPSEEKQIDKK